MSDASARNEMLWRAARPPSAGQEGDKAGLNVEHSDVADTLDVRLEALTKRFDDVVAVDGISLDVKRGEFLALLGPSGCGKTTTLRMIGGFERPTSGRLVLGQRDAVGVPSYKRDVNTVFQSYALFPHLTVFENVAYGLRRRRVKGEELRRRVEDALELVGLGDVGGRRSTQLSGGQQQRTALARALVNRPRVLLLDEPLGALDLKLRRQMQLELKRIQHEVGITFIHVTHDQEEAMTMADRIVVMNQGRVEQLGTPMELYEQPSTAFVANFLGVSNLLDGAVADADHVRLRDGTLVSVLPAAVVGRTGAVRIGIRPEKVMPGSGEMNELAGTVQESVYIGVSTQYLVETPVGGIRMLVHNDGVGQRFTVGECVVVSWNAASTFVVDGS